MKKIWLILFTFICFFSVTTVVRADESSFTCYYKRGDLAPFYIEYDIENNELDFGYFENNEKKSVNDRTWISADKRDYYVLLNEWDFVDTKSNSLRCPTIWTVNKSNSSLVSPNLTTFGKIYVYPDDSHGGDKYTPTYDKYTATYWDYFSKIRYCSWQDGSLNIKAKIDVENRKILNATVNGKDAKTYPRFNDVYDDQFGIFNTSSCRSDVLAYCNGDNCVIGKSSDENFMKEKDKAKGEVVGEEEVYGCEVIPEAIRNWIKRALNLVKYIALVLVIVLGVMDFIKAAASGEADQMKKSGTSFIKRVVAVIILFLLPYLVDLILGLINIYGANSTCLPNK